MFDIGMQELIVIFIVILIVFGPKRAPELGRAVGKALSELKRSFQDVKKQVETEFKESTSDIQEAKKSLEDLKMKFESSIKETIGVNTFQQSSRGTIEEINETEEKDLENEDLEEEEEAEEVLESEEKEEKDKNSDTEIQHEDIQKEEGLDARR